MKKLVKDTRSDLGFKEGLPEDMEKKKERRRRRRRGIRRERKREGGGGEKNAVNWRPTTSTALLQALGMY